MIGTLFINYEHLSQKTNYFSVELPEVCKWSEEGKIITPLQTVKLSEIESAWETPEDKGKRIGNDIIIMFRR